MQIKTIDEIIVAYAYRNKLDNDTYHQKIYTNLVKIRNSEGKGYTVQQ